MRDPREKKWEKGGGVEHNITKEECHRDGGHRDGHRDRDAVLLLLLLLVVRWSTLSTLG